MRRKKLLTAGLFLSIDYAIMLVALFCLMIAALAYTMLDTVEIANDLLYAVLQPFIIGDNTKMLMFIGGLLVGCIYLVILSTRISKYSKFNETMFKSKKAIVTLCIISFILALGGIGYWLYTNLSGASFQENLILNSILALNAFIHLVSIILIIIGAAQGFSEKVLKQQMKAEDKLASTRPPIYTAGLDENEIQQDAQKNAKTPPKAKPVIMKESELSKKLIDSIGKLDQMRKNGSISTTEYTKLRSQIIRNLTKK